MQARVVYCAACFTRQVCSTFCALLACASKYNRTVHTCIQALYSHTSAGTCVCAVHASKYTSAYACAYAGTHRHASACFCMAITTHRRSAVFTFAPWPHKNKLTVSSHAPVKKLSSQTLGGDGQWQGMVAMRSRSHIHTQVGQGRQGFLVECVFLKRPRTQDFRIRDDF